MTTREKSLPPCGETRMRRKDISASSYENEYIVQDIAFTAFTTHKINYFSVQEKTLLFLRIITQ